MASIRDGDFSAYTADPSETNCSIVEAVNQEPDEASNYSLVDSETNVTMKEHFAPCKTMNDLNMSVYSAPKSETNVTMKEPFERCQDVAAAVYSTYTAPPSETNVTLHDSNDFKPDVSEYSAPASETNVTMADGFRKCHVIKDFGKKQSEQSVEEKGAEKGACVIS